MAYKKEYHTNYCRNRYNNDIDYNKSIKYYKMLWRKKQYVKNGQIELISNYNDAKLDDFIGWDIHHKLEINNGYTNTSSDLKLMNLYYNRPPEELIWLKHGEHTKIHKSKRG